MNSSTLYFECQSCWLFGVVENAAEIAGCRQCGMPVHCSRHAPFLQPSQVGFRNVRTTFTGGNPRNSSVPGGFGSGAMDQQLFQPNLQRGFRQGTFPHVAGAQTNRNPSHGGRGSVRGRGRGRGHADRSRGRGQADRGRGRGRGDSTRGRGGSTQQAPSTRDGGEETTGSTGAVATAQVSQDQQAQTSHRPLWCFVCSRQGHLMEDDCDSSKALRRLRRNVKWINTTGYSDRLMSRLMQPVGQINSYADIFCHIYQVNRVLEGYIHFAINRDTMARNLFENMEVFRAPNSLLMIFAMLMAQANIITHTYVMKMVQIISKVVRNCADKGASQSLNVFAIDISNSKLNTQIQSLLELEPSGSEPGAIADFAGIDSDMAELQSQFEVRMQLVHLQTRKFLDDCIFIHNHSMKNYFRGAFCFIHQAQVRFRKEYTFTGIPRMRWPQLNFLIHVWPVTIDLPYGASDNLEYENCVDSKEGFDSRGEATGDDQAGPVLDTHKFDIAEEPRAIIEDNNEDEDEMQD